MPIVLYLITPLARTFHNGYIELEGYLGIEGHNESNLVNLLVFTNIQ